MTASNDDGQIDRLIEVLTELSTKFRLQTASTMARWWEGSQLAHKRAK